MGLDTFWGKQARNNFWFFFFYFSELESTLCVLLFLSASSVFRFLF